MRAHRRPVLVESEPGRGSAFTLVFPVAMEAGETRVMKRILVIEDEPQMRLGLRDSLELDGYEVLTAADGGRGCPQPPTPTSSFST